MRNLNRWGWCGVFVLTVLLPLIMSSSYQRHLLVMTAIAVIMASGLNLMVGFLGELSLGHSAYFGIGAYASALVVMNFGMPFWIGLAVAGGLSGVFGLLIGYPSLKLRGPYFAITTLGFVMIIWLLVVNLVGLTNGPMGIVGIPAPSISISYFTFNFISKLSYYYLLLAFTWATLLIIHRIINSRVGKAFTACRENEELAEAIGIDTFRFRLKAFVIGTFFIGIAGSFYAHYICFIDPEVFSWYYIVTMLVMVLVGGSGTIAGPVIGAVLFTWLPEYLRAATIYRMSLYSLILIVVIIFMPNGIYGYLKQVLFQRTKEVQDATS